MYWLAIVFHMWHLSEQQDDRSYMLFSSWLTTCFEYILSWWFWLKWSPQNLRLYVCEIIDNTKAIQELG